MLTLDLISKDSRGTNSSLRETFFHFPRMVRKSVPGVVLIVTGGFKSWQEMEDTLSPGGCDTVRIGEPAGIL